MTFAMRAAAAAFLLVGTTGICVAQIAGSAPASPSFDDLVGHKLTAIDGSSISFNPAEGGIAREIVSANGAIQRIYFTFINDRLGTVADATDIRKITGVFRRTGTGIQIDYADGSTEKLAVSPGGGVTLQTVSANVTSCMAWYPEGHKFTLDERKAALAAFAAKLGLADPAGSAPKSDCGTPVATMGAIPAAAPAPAPESAKVVAGTVQPARETSIAVPAVPAVPAAGALVLGGNAAAAVAPAAIGSLPSTAATAAETRSVEVRNSPIHLIDPAPAADSKPQVLASATPPDSLAPTQRGASACLSVESDGSHWGFRNHCGYTVQFAYCLMGPGQLASCSDGAVAGSVAGNGFGALVADESLKETDAKHDFRWVACQGGAGEVIPHLDQIDPPSGRCVR
jgi:hypothetical protein